MWLLSGTPGTADIQFSRVQEDRRQPGEHLEMQQTSLKALCITIKQSAKYVIFCENTAAVSGSYTYYSLFNDFETHLFHLYSQQYIYLSMYQCNYVSKYLGI